MLNGYPSSLRSAAYVFLCRLAQATDLPLQNSSMAVRGALVVDRNCCYLQYLKLEERCYLLKMKSEELNLEKYVKLVLEEEFHRDDTFLTEEELKTMLAECSKDSRQRESIIGYPSYPLYREVGNMLNLWLENKHCPALDLPRFDLLDEKSHSEQREVTFSSIMPMLEGLQTLHDLWTEEEIKYRVRQVLVLLGLRGILDLLGIRKTIGTKEMLPPSRTALMASFCAKHNEKSELSVGARALSKHFHRDQSSSWWGDCSGTDAVKNRHALELCTKVLDNAVWINIHWLPHDVFIIEARQAQGYGVRWSADASMFRGFLEPQMVDGHEVGWKH
ncbi:uncharacterized protein LOC101864002 [Aplysia californica]|uniref:Uncharacterized protein LOC101864002 n=1 Tax=Aplysia californica TaxID=6500 RepID=A0ABM0JYK9_APLCA|nr:uncharacterized protein LOC101864002 [Aplysia californica]